MRLADEKPVLNKTVDRIRRGYLDRTDHRAMRQFRMDEFARDREDQVGLEQRIDDALRSERVEVRKGEPVGRVGQRSNRRLHAIAREIHPLQEMGDLVAADPQRDLQHFGALHLLAH